MNVLDRPDWRGACASALLPLSVAALVYAVMLAAGFTHGNPAFAELPFDSTGWIAATIWVLLFGLYGITRWRAVTLHGPEGERTSWLIVAMMVWALAYTVIAGSLSHFWLEAANVFSLALGIFTASRVVRLSRRLVAWLVPTFLWKVLALIIGLAPMLGFTLS